MGDRHINFRPYQVRAALDGRLSQTRLVLKPLPRRTIFFDQRTADQDQFQQHPYAPGDRLWVREAWTDYGLAEGEVVYCATAFDDTGYTLEEIAETRWRPSIHMPRWASRLTLTVTNVRVQRLQEISNEDAISEGIEPHGHAFTGYGKQSDIWMAPYDSFASLWNSLHGPDAWDANPWVCALTFTVQLGNIDQIGGGNE